MEPNTTNTATQATAALTATVAGAQDSLVARSLFSANWEQLITLNFHLQMGDVIGLIGLALAADAFLSRRRTRR